MYTVIYNEGLGFTERTKKYESLSDAMRVEGLKLIDGCVAIYKDGKKVL